MAGGTLASLKIMLGLDSAGVEKGVATANKSIGGLSTTAKVATGIVTGLAVGGFAMMTKGAMEMEGAQGKFQAATGASREEAVAFSKDMNGLVGNAATVGKSFDEIAAAGTGVAQQFGLTGKAGADMTQSFLAFSKVTGQDALGAVNDFDAALDAFGLPASRATGLMDQLVASNQKYGTVAGPEALAALAGMAPALNAMNMGLDEGVGLLNLFEASGLDAAGAQKALNAAVKNLPPGDNINDVITRLAAIEDPALRAQEAIKVFGAKAGVGLANAIKPGMTSLDDFIPKVEDVAGKTGKAADDMVTTADKFKMGFERIGSALRGLGSDFGPLVTGIGAIATGLGPILVKALGGLAALPGVRAAGLAIGTVVGEAQALAQQAAATGTAAVTAMFVRIAGMAIPLAPAGTTVGTAIGGAMGLGMAAGLIGIGAAAVMQPAITKFLAEAYLTSHYRDDLANEAHNAAMVYAEGYDETVRNEFAGIVQKAVRDALETGSSEKDALAAGEVAGHAYIDGIAKPFTGNVLQNQAGPGLEQFNAYMAQLGARGGDKTAVEWNSAFKTQYDQGNADLVADASLSKALEAQMAAAHKIAAWGGAETPRAFAQGAKSSFDSVTSAFDQLKQLMKDTLSPTKQIAELIGIATSKRLAKGLADGRPEVRGEAQQIALDTLAELHRLEPGSSKIGELVTKLLAGALPNERPYLQDQIALIVGDVKQPLATLPPLATRTGNKIVNNLATALYSGRHVVYDAAYALARTVSNVLRVDSPAKEGPWSENGGPIAWMFKTGVRMTGGFAAGLRFGFGGLQKAMLSLVNAGLPGRKLYNILSGAADKALDQTGQQRVRHLLDVKRTIAGLADEGALGPRTVRLLERQFRAIDDGVTGRARTIVGTILKELAGAKTVRHPGSLSNAYTPMAPEASRWVINVHINGNIYGGAAGLRQLYADIERAVRQGTRGANRAVGR